MYHIILKRKIKGISSFFRVTPDFIINGVIKTGTTFLYDNATQHPSIIPAETKELSYFDTNYDLGQFWYRSFFPTIYKKKALEKIQKKVLTGEATPMYSFDKNAPLRIHNLNPSMKIITIFRNPIDRAYSHYNMQVDNGYENRTFEEVINEEINHIQNKIETKKEISIKLHDYVAIGLYAEQIKNWQKYFPYKQILIIDNYELLTKPQETFNKFFKFLGIPAFEIKSTITRKKGNYKPMRNETRKILSEFYKSKNEEFFKLINKNFRWD